MKNSLFIFDYIIISISKKYKILLNKIILNYKISLFKIIIKITLK